MTGVVEQFDIQRGWGFIRPDQDGQDLFVHFVDILDAESNGFRVLYPDDVVAFDCEQAPRGPRARNLRIMERARTETV